MIIRPINHIRHVLQIFDFTGVLLLPRLFSGQHSWFLFAHCFIWESMTWWRSKSLSLTLVSGFHFPALLLTSWATLVGETFWTSVRTHTLGIMKVPCKFVWMNEVTCAMGYIVHWNAVRAQSTRKYYFQVSGHHDLFFAPIAWNRSGQKVRTHFCVPTMYQTLSRVINATSLDFYNSSY